VPIWGDGTQTVDLIYTPDIARMLVDAMKFGDDVTFDGGTGRAFTVNEVLNMVAHIAGTHPDPQYLPMRRGEIPTHIVATGEGWDRLDWSPEFRFQDLVETVKSYR
jgi:UDP-glucose 4-epimerase